MSSHIKCIKCGTFNTNKTYCANCGAVLSHIKRRKLAYAKAEKERKARQLKQEKENPSFFEKYSKHKYFIVRALTRIFHSVWLGFIAIGTFIAWLFTAIAA